MPSGSYIDLTFTPNTIYTAPADGYFVVCRTAGAVGEYINVYNNGTGSAANAVRVAQGFNASKIGQYRLFVPCAKGHRVYIGTNFSGSSATYDYFGFIYAKGSAPQS